MIGGGEGAFIGAVHRMALAIDGNIDLVAGCFSQSAEKSIAFGLTLGLAEHRCYPSYDTMLASEEKLPKNEQIDFVIIVTPNNTHFEIAKLALNLGFHVFCEKPATVSLHQSIELKQLVEESKLTYALAHTYIAYPMVMEARNRVAQGDIGNIQKVMVDYSQGWLAANYLSADQKQAKWRLSPEQAGISCCMADIGVHGANLAEFIVNDRISDVLADLSSTGNRQLDDDGTVLLRFRHGARGTLSASQVCVGEENNLSIKIYGDSGSIKWHHHEPNTLLIQQGNEPQQLLRNAGAYLSSSSLLHSRTPAGHPQGYVEAFANLYQQFQQQLIKNEVSPLLPTIEQGVAGMAFVEAVVESNTLGNKWIHLSA